MPDILFHIDEPVRWDNPVPLILARGWCFARSGPPVVQIRAVTSDGEWEGVHGLARPDVANAFDHAPGSAESGWVARFPRPESGSREVAFEALLKDETRHILSTVKICQPPPPVP